ncbi:MAG: carbonic anhydrase, partial [Azoarcus sp.]|nr:carbonic anhydrase [Azoarcus sp.]
MNESIAQLFANNRAWSQHMQADDPTYFLRLVGQQSPEYLWIGCSDSRVPANQIIGLDPGEVFVHRNVANLVVHTDLNALSVIQYAVDILKVKHILVVGHYGCGGVKAALENARDGLVDNWLRHVQDVRDRHAAHLAQVQDPAMRLDRLCELNVIHQTINVCQTTVMRDVWARG